MACEKDLVKGLRSGVWAWWEFSGMEKLLFVDGSEDILTDFADVLPRQVMFKRLEETREEDWMQKHAASVDAVLSIASLEKCEHPAEVLSVWRKLLKPEGRLLLGMNNRFGLRYFCGDRDSYTRRSFDGVTGTSMPIAGRRTDFAGVCTAEPSFGRCCRRLDGSMSSSIPSCPIWRTVPCFTRRMLCRS